MRSEEMRMRKTMIMRRIGLAMKASQKLWS